MAQPMKKKKEEKMDVEEKPKFEVNEEEELPFINLESRAELERLAAGYVEDENEESVLMTYAEIEEYLRKKIAEYSKDPEVNPNLGLKKRIRELRDQMRDKKEELQKLKKAFDEIYRNQVKFFRHIGILQKIEAKSIGISVDLPILPESIPTNVSDAKKEFVPSKDFAEAKVLSPSIKRSANPDSAAQSSTSANKPNPKPDINIECIDLTDDTPMPSCSNSAVDISKMLKHPAPVPARPYSIPNKDLPNVPPKPRLGVTTDGTCITLQWDMPPSTPANPTCAKLGSFEIFGYQEQPNAKINSLLWQKIGAVDAMNLPMVCKLNQFLDGHTYHFTIRAVDIYKRCGSYSSPASIVYKLKE